MFIEQQQILGVVQIQKTIIPVLRVCNTNNQICSILPNPNIWVPHTTCPVGFSPFLISMHSQGNWHSNISYTEFTQCFIQGKSRMCPKCFFQQLNIRNDIDQFLCMWQLAVLLMFPVKLDRMGRDMGGGFRREGAYGYLWLIHVDVWQKPAQYCKVIILQ